ncbi:hypothetical protein SLEP1_g59226 [Rubroshorea leprosula]|uniref:Uncharacterized protein n=1 Tax=Rubroshorea leprosula TaxID=152421 RepID=A0AAV5MT90_9ROSI|nr:hypothetical protein SLEP1_g59226 [Rubroshorea leprosula]
MYIDPTVPWNHKTIDCLAEIILRYYEDITIFSCSKSIPAKTNCMYIDPTIPWNHKTIDCLAEIILRYYGVISLQNHERIS